MKTLSAILLVFTALICASCNKSDLAFPSQNITGTWNVVSDSTFAAGIDAPNHQSVSHKYTGLPGDHFIFTSNEIYIKESTVETDTATYIISKDTLRMVYAHFNEGNGNIANAHMNFLISSSDAHTLVLTSTNLPTPAGEFTEDITLSR